MTEKKKHLSLLLAGVAVWGRIIVWNLNPPPPRLPSLGSADGKPC